MSFVKGLQGVKSLFSSNQNLFLKDFIPTVLQGDYKYYIAYTNTSTGNYYTSENDLFVLVSTEPISAEGGYKYQLAGECKLYEIRTGNYNSSTSANNTERVKVSDYTATSLTIDVYEHIYTNAEYETIIMQPNINMGESVTNVNLQATNVLLAVFLLSYFILFIWKIRK